MPDATATATTAAYTCPKCGNPGEKQPGRAMCLPCYRALHRETNERYRQRNPQVCAARCERWRRTHRAWVNEHSRDVYRADPERKQRYVRRYQQRNRDYINARQSIKVRYRHESDPRALSAALFARVWRSDAYIHALRSVLVPRLPDVDAYSLVRRGLAEQYRIARPGEVLPAGERVVRVFLREENGWTDYDPLRKGKP